MFYFIYGDKPLLLKYEEVIKEIKKNNENIPMKVYDASQGEEENFLEGISTNSIFSPKELLVLKRSEKIKKLDKFFEIVEKYDHSQKEVVVLYEEFLNDYGKATNEINKKVLSVTEKLGKNISARKKDEKRSLQFYIEKELKISEYESEKLIDILGDDFFKVKNEIEKIKNFIGGEKFDLEKVTPILSVSKEYNLKKIIEDFMENFEIFNLIEFLKINKEYMFVIYLLSEELNLALKLVSLKKMGLISVNQSYNAFKSNSYDEIKKYFKTTRGYTKEYPIFLKLKYADKFSEKFLLSKIDEILKLEYSIKNGKISEELGVEKYLIKFIEDKKKEDE